MADPIEEKESLTDQLEKDRQKMADRASELKRNYNIGSRLKAAVQKYPWLSVVSAVLVGFLLSRLPARRREVYLWSERLQREDPAKLTPVVTQTPENGPIHKIWLFVKPLVSAYFVRKFHRLFRRPRSAETSDKTSSGSRCEQSE
jgi:hypothetical protein